MFIEINAFEIKLGSEFTHLSVSDLSNRCTELIFLHLVDSEFTYTALFVLAQINWD